MMYHYYITYKDLLLLLKYKANFLKQSRNPCSGSLPVNQDLSMFRDWPVKKSFVELPIMLKGNSKIVSGDSLSPLGIRTNIGAA